MIDRVVMVRMDDERGGWIVTLYNEKGVIIMEKEGKQRFSTYIDAIGSVPPSP